MLLSNFKLNKSALSLVILALFPAYSANATSHVFHKYVEGLLAEPVNQHPTYAVNPSATQSFPSTTEGTNSAGVPFTISSIGNRPVQNLSFNTIGDFTAYNSTCGTYLAVGASCNVTVRFNPTSAGAKSGSLVIGASNVTGSSSVGLSGIGTPIPVAASAHIVADTGADVSVTVPAGVTSITAKVWGAAGGSMANGWVFYGGVGGYARCDISVTPGETLTVKTGRGGIKGGIAGNAWGASGGGYSGVFRGATPLIIAGGGGGAENTNGGGGAGNGPSTTGASTTSGGTGPCDRGCGANGTQYNGGAGYGISVVAGGWPGGGAGASKTGDWGGSGGGAGYWGGAGTPGSGGGTSGAGGGSGYTGGCNGSSITTGSTAFVNSGAMSVPANNDADYSAGVGGYVANGNGNSGRVVLYY